jgi:pilus assembly protein Flp/PilA
MRRQIARFLSDERGATAIEYGIIAAMISVAIIGVLTSIGVNLIGKMQAIIDAIANAGA